MKGLRQLLECPADDLKAWMPYRSADASDDGEAFELLIRCADGDDQRAFFAKHAKRKATDEQQRDFWLGHVIDWRGVYEDDGKPLAFDVTLLRALWRRDSHFGVWLITESQKLDNFRRSDS